MNSLHIQNLRLSSKDKPTQPRSRSIFKTTNDQQQRYFINEEFPKLRYWQYRKGIRHKIVRIHIVMCLYDPYARLTSFSVTNIRPQATLMEKYPTEMAGIAAPPSPPPHKGFMKNFQLPSSKRVIQNNTLWRVNQSN